MGIIAHDVTLAVFLRRRGRIGSMSSATAIPISPAQGFKDLVGPVRGVQVHQFVPPCFQFGIVKLGGFQIPGRGVGAIIHTFLGRPSDIVPAAAPSSSATATAAVLVAVASLLSATTFSLTIVIIVVAIIVVVAIITVVVIITVVTSTSPHTVRSSPAGRIPPFVDTPSESRARLNEHLGQLIVHVLDIHDPITVSQQFAGRGWSVPSGSLQIDPTIATDDQRSIEIVIVVLAKERKKMSLL